MKLTTVVFASLLLAAGHSEAQTAAPAAAAVPTITYHYENTALSPSAYTLTFAEDGTGHYHSEPGTAGAAPQKGATGQPFDADIHITGPMRQQWFQQARTHHFFAVECEAPKSKVAFTGSKTLRYSGPDGTGTCTYNYARDPQLNKLAELAYAISNTIEVGRVLRFDIQYDHLGLDAELEALDNYVKAGRAAELGNIYADLSEIDGNAGVMARARSRAHALLQKATQ